MQLNQRTKIGILGGGVEGIALAEYLNRNGYEDVLLYDEKKEGDFWGTHEQDKNALSPNVRTVLGPDAFSAIFDREVLFRSPGIHIKRLEEARAKGIHVTSTTQYFFENCPCPIVGVTGTKGKGTTSTLIYMMLKDAGRDAYLGGNIGESPLNFLDSLKPDSIAVLELSSFQLHDLTVSPHVAVVLMTTSDHMDYHADTAEYWEAKTSIVRYQNPGDFLVLNKDHEYCEYFSKLSPAHKLDVSMQDIQGDGAHIAGPKIVNCLRGKCEMIGDTSKVALLGKHNLENALAAIAAARVLDVPIPIVQKVIYTFTGLPHRLEFVREFDGVKYYNDSFSTTPETSVAAAYAFKGPVVLIAGGSEKHSDFSDWGAMLQQCANLKYVILMGVTADRMEKTLSEAAEKLKAEFPLKKYRAESLPDAINIARKNTVSGDSVVMSPATASFDMFKNYKERGEKFRALVNELT